MKELRDHLQDADPLAEEPPLEWGEVLQMRRRLLAARGQRREPRRSRRGVVTGTAIVGVSVAAITMLLRSPGNVSDGAHPTTRALTTAGIDDPGLRRVYFETPGGTRVIWLFQPESSERPHP